MKHEDSGWVGIRYAEEIRSISYSALCSSDFILAPTVWKSDKLSWVWSQKINRISMIYIYYGCVVCQVLYGTYILHENVLSLQR